MRECYHYCIVEPEQVVRQFEVALVSEAAGLAASAQLVQGRDVMAMRRDSFEVELCRASGREDHLEPVQVQGPLFLVFAQAGQYRAFLWDCRAPLAKTHSSWYSLEVLNMQNRQNSLSAQGEAAEHIEDRNSALDLVDISALAELAGKDLLSFHAVAVLYPLDRSADRCCPRNQCLLSAAWAQVAHCRIRFGRIARGDPLVIDCEVPVVESWVAEKQPHWPWVLA